MSRVLCLALSVGLLSSSAHAQGDVVLELYGEGVHRYFAGDMDGASELFSRVIDSGSQDPRAYYYRGLVLEMQGEGQGQSDFETGAQLEAQGKRAVPVGQALTRIQGYLRSKIEQARRDARVLYRQQQLAEEQDRMDRLDETPGVVETPMPTEPPVPSDTTETPFDEGMRSDETTDDPAPTTTQPEIDDGAPPFAGDTPAPAPETTAPAADPFSTPPADSTPADPFSAPAAETPAAADPFGAPAGDPGTTADPFGAPAGDSGAGAADPFGAPASDAPAAGGAASDPFGGSDPFGTGQ